MDNNRQISHIESSGVIMIVDDDPDQQGLLKQYLQTEQYHFIRMKDGAEALAYLQQRDALLPHLIILDFHLPDMDGLAVLRQIKAQPTTQNTPIIIKTVHFLDDETIAACFDEGAADHIIIPVSAIVLRARIKSAIRLDALENALDRRTYDLSALTKLSQAIGHLWKLDDILAQTLDGLFQVMPLVSAVIFRVSQDERTIQLSVERGLSPERKAKIQTQAIAPDSDVAGQTAFSRQTIVKDNNLVGIPLIIMHRAVGVMQFQTHRDYRFTQNEIHILEAIAAQVAAKVENTLFQEDIERTHREVVKMYHANRALNQATTLEAIGQAIASYAINRKLDLVSVWLFEPPHRRGESPPKQVKIVSQWQSNGASSFLEENAPNLEALDFYRGVKRTEPLLVSDIERDVSLGPAMQVFLTRKLGLQAVAFIPMLAQDTWVGVVVLGIKAGKSHIISPEILRAYWLMAGQAATTIINFQFYQSAQRQALEMGVINEMSRAFTSSLDLSQVLQTIISQISSVLPADACSIFLVDEENEDLIFEASLDPEGIPTEFRRLPAGQGIVGWVVDHAQAQLVTDVPQDSRHYPQIGQVMGLTAGSIICSPIIRQDNVLGAIQSINKRANAFTEADLQLLTAAANHAAVAIDNARLHKETLQRLAELSMLQMAGSQLAATIEMEALLEIVVSSATILMDADSGSILLFNKNSLTEARRLDVTFDQLLNWSEVIIRPNGIAHKVMEDGMLVVSNASQTHDLSRYVLQKKWGSFIGISLETGARALGVLYINNIAPRKFARHELSLLETFVNQASLALEHASLYQETQENFRRISTLYEIAQTARHLRDQNRMLKFISVTVRRYFSAAGVSFFELSDKGVFSPLHLPNISRDKIVAYQKQPWRITETLFQPLVEGNSIQIPSLQEMQDEALRNRLIYEDAASWYAIPLWIEDQVIGIMVLAGRVPDLADEEELQFLYTIAGHAAVTLENARLVNELEMQTTALKEANRQLKEANEVKSRFLTTVSHELRTPMNSIIGYGELLQDELDGPLTLDQTNSVERILRNGRNLLALINDVLDFSKIEAGRLDVQLQYFPLYDALDSALEVVSPLAERKGLSLVINGIGDSMHLYADPARTHQVLLNLLSNAIKFTDQGSIRIEAAIKNDQVLISVSDTGIGIPPEELPYLFDEFHQLDSSMTREYGGTGLGLTISKRLLTLMNGQIEVESKLGEGSTFAIILPRGKTAEEQDK